MRVLVVDPNAAEREITVRALATEQHEVEAVKDAAAALAVLEKKRPDAVVVETTMTGITGFELVKRLRAGEEITARNFIVMTASKQAAGDMKTAFGVGADDFVRKPINKEELVLRVEGAMRVRSWARLTQGAAGAVVDLTTGGGDITHTQSWATVEDGMCGDVGDMLAMPLTPMKATNVLKGAVVGAQLPLSMASESFEVRVAVAADAESARALAAHLFGNPDAPEGDVRDMMREMANIAAGCFKRTSAAEGRMLTTGLPLNGSPMSFLNESAKARKEWTATCGTTGAVLRFEVQYLTAESKALPVKSLKEGMVLAHDLLNKSGALLMRSGTRLTESKIAQLPRALGDGALVAVMSAAA
jgi:CheY-like chemotaxis protein